MKISANEIRPGNVLEHKDRLWQVVRTEHVKPGKGPAYQQAELKDLVDGTKLNERFGRSRRSSASASTSRATSSCTRRAASST
jgi:elongation factor P